MMSQRFTLFYAGFTAHVPALYFNQVELVESWKHEENQLLAAPVSQLSERLNDKTQEYITHLDTAISVAKHLEIETLPRPQTPEDYFSWVVHYTDSFEKAFPMGRIDHYYFLFARKVAEIISNLELVKVCIDFTVASQGTLDLSRKMEKCIKDIEYILFKLMAAAALLSSEPRQNYFNSYYRLLCQEFQGCKSTNADITDIASLKKLHAAITEFDLVVMDGFKKCIGMLKELGI